MNKVMPIDEAVGKYLRAGQTVMVGGFGRGGVPFSVLEYISSKSDVYKDFLLVKNDANEPGLGVGRLLANGQAHKLIATHIGLNPDFIGQMNRGEVECELVPQGIFAEKIRAGGAGIPAFLSDIGMDTVVAVGKPRTSLDGKEYVIERSIRGDVALLCADKVDRRGNAWWRGSNRNMNIVMALACERVIMEAKEIVEIGEIEPENVHLPHVCVHAVVQAQPRSHMKEAGNA